MNTQKQLVHVERIHKLDKNGATKAFVDILVAGSFKVKGLRVVQGKDSLFVAMPSDKGKDDKWYPVFYPVSSEVKQELHNAVLKAYEKMLEKAVSC